MAPLYKVHTRTHPGSVRDINEDAVSTVLEWRGPLELHDESLRSRGHLFVVADGMGGHAAGEVASRMAVEKVFHSYYESQMEPGEAGLRAAIAGANQVLCQEAASQPSQHGMGTTFVAALLVGAEMLVANVGDSRAYLYHERRITQITSDHSWVAEQVNAGVLTPEEAARHPYRNVITRSLGPDRDPTPDFFHLAVQPGDLLLLCSDGLSNLVTPADLGELLSAYPADEAADLMLERSLERGAPDNVSFVLIEYLGEAGGRGAGRNRRSTWPWLLGAVLLLAGAGVLFGDQLRGFLPGPAGLGGLATPTPTTQTMATPSSTPSPVVVVIVLPTATPTLAAPAAQVLRVGAIELAAPGAGTPTPDLADRFGGAPGMGSLRGVPQRDRYVFYLEGLLQLKLPQSDGWKMAVAHVDGEGTPRLYNFILRGDWLPGARQPEVGERVALIGQPVVETSLGSSIDIEPQLMLNTTAQSGQGQPLWVQDGDTAGWLRTHIELWVFTVYGPGGGEGLGVATPPDLAGLPIALWGGWLPPAAGQDPTTGPVRFHSQEQAAYEWVTQEQLYRQPDN